MTAVLSLSPGASLPQHGPVVISVDDMVRWAAASRDFTQFHYDPAAAADRGFPGPVAHGPWKSAVVRALIRQWFGNEIQLRQLAVRYLCPDVVGDSLTFGGRIEAVDETDDWVRRIRCTIWADNQDGRRTLTATCVADAEPPADGLPIERLKSAVRMGSEAGTFVYRIESNDIERFVEAIGGSELAESKPGTAPTTYFAALDPVERRDLDLDEFLHRLPFPKQGGGNAFNEVEYERPLRVGDVITVTTRYTDVYEKAGRSGRLLFRVRVNEMRDAGGELVATSRCGHVLGYDLPGTQASDGDEQ